MKAYQPSVPTAPEEEDGGGSRSQVLSRAILDQSPAQIDVVGKRLTGAPLSKPLLIDEFGKPAKTKCGNVNRIALASRWSFKEIAPASRTAMLDKRFAGLDFHHPAFDPVVATPRVAIHRKSKLQRQGFLWATLIVAEVQYAPAPDFMTSSYKEDAGVPQRTHEIAAP